MSRRVGAARVLAGRRALRAAAAFGSALAGVPVTAEAFAPRTNYALHCQGCHLADGRETPGLVPKLRGTVGTLAATPGGRDYLVRLPNVAAVPLDDRDLAALLDWIVLAFGDREGRAEPFGPQEVSARRRPLLDVEGARRAVLGTDESSGRSAP